VILDLFRRLCTVVLLAAPVAGAVEPFLEKQDLFTVGDDPAY